MNKYTILVVDDNAISREMLGMIFEKTYNIIYARTGEEAVQIIDSLGPVLSAIFLDVVMPQVDGMQILKYMHDNKLVNKIPVIMITADNSVEIQSLAYELGASDFIYKPFIPRVVSNRTKNLIELYNYKNKIEDSLEEAQQEIKDTNEFLIDALSTVVEFRNLESGDHIKRVKTFTQIMAKCLKENCIGYNLTDADVELITRASVLHDIGKIAIPDKILLKPGKLTDEEFEEMKKHTTYGADLLQHFMRSGRDNKFYKYAQEIARSHHERYNGKGYPDGLVGDFIPISAQIVSIVDVYDALVSKRCYKDAYDIEEAFNMIKNGECGTFSDTIMDCFVSSKDDIISTTTQLNS